MKTIAIDIDDVISPFTESFVHYHNSTYGTNMSIEDFKAPGDYWGFYEGVIAKILNDPDNVEEYKRRFWEYLETDRHAREQPIYEETKRCLYELKKNYNLEVVTARDGAIKESTIEWLNEQLPDLFSDVHFNSSWKDGERKTKAAVCQAIGADYLIDDSVEHCNSSAECGVNAILFGNYGWNSHHEIHENVTRITDWPSVLEYFNSIDKK